MRCSLLIFAAGAPALEALISLHPHRRRRCAPAPLAASLRSVGRVGGARWDAPPAEAADKTGRSLGEAFRTVLLLSVGAAAASGAAVGSQHGLHMQLHHGWAAPLLGVATAGIVLPAAAVASTAALAGPAVSEVTATAVETAWSAAIPAKADKTLARTTAAVLSSDDFKGRFARDLVTGAGLVGLFGRIALAVALPFGELVVDAVVREAANDVDDSAESERAVAPLLRRAAGGLAGGIVRDLGTLAVAVAGFAEVAAQAAVVLLDKLPLPG